jgi:hypothetical protein
MITDQPFPHIRNLARALACAAVLFLGTARIATQSRIIPPQQPANANLTAQRPKVTTLRATDSAEGSRVAVTADQSLNEYEAYRRGDRFYVKIPPADVPRAELVRGRAFSDVKVQRVGDSTIVSFRLQPGATARVEPHGNKLDVVFTMPGAKLSSSAASRDVARNDAGPAPPGSDRKRQPAKNANSSVRLNIVGSSVSRNANERALFATAKHTPTPKPGPTPKASPSTPPSSTISAQTSPTPKISPVIAQQRSTASPSLGGSPAQQPAQTNTWNDLRQRVRYWILLAQLNPIPVAIGAAVLLFLLGLLILQRRRTRAARRARLRNPPRRVAPLTPEAKPLVAAATESVKPGVVAVTAANLAATSPTASPQPPTETTVSSPRQERVERVSDELKKLMAGGDYDENILASDDREERQLVGAELLSALVGRNLQRRERARAAFMKHGYFDDATRDLRIADSANERAAAARRLSFVHDREATPHLIAALDDSSPDVRRAAVEALMDLRDPASIAPLNSLMQNESDRRVPRSLIKHAIESCASSTHDEPAPTRSVSSVPSASPLPVSPAVETEREVIEI